MVLMHSYVLVRHVLEHPELPVGPLGVDGRLEGAGQLLDSHLEVGAVLQHGLGVGRAADLKHRASC